MESALLERPINTSARAPKMFVVFTANGDTQYLLALGLLGVLGNVCMMVTILARKRWRHAANAFIFHHAFLDLAKSLYYLMIAANFVAPTIPELCTKLRVSHAYFVTTTIFNMAAMVVNELFHLRNMDVDLTVPPFALCKCILFGLFILWFGTGLLLFGVVLLASDTFKKLGSWDQRSCLLMNCELQNSDPISRMYFINTFWILVNVAGILMTAHFLRSYHRDIRMTCYHHTLHLLSTASMTVGPVDAEMLTDSSKTRAVRARLEAPAMRRLRVLTLLLVAFVVFWHPIFLLLIIDTQSQGSLFIYKCANLIAWTSSTLNPIIFLFFNKRLNRCLELPSPCLDMRPCSKKKVNKKVKGWTVKASTVRVPENFSFMGQRGHQQLQSLINRRPYGNRPSNNGMDPALTALTTPIGSISGLITDVASPISQITPTAATGFLSPATINKNGSTFDFVETMGDEVNQQERADYLERLERERTARNERVDPDRTSRMERLEINREMSRALAREAGWDEDVTVAKQLAEEDRGMTRSRSSSSQAQQPFYTTPEHNRYTRHDHHLTTLGKTPNANNPGTFKGIEKNAVHNRYLPNHGTGGTDTSPESTTRIKLFYADNRTGVTSQWEEAV